VLSASNLSVSFNSFLSFIPKSNFSISICNCFLSFYVFKALFTDDNVICNCSTFSSSIKPFLKFLWCLIMFFQEWFCFFEESVILSSANKNISIGINYHFFHFLLVFILAFSEIFKYVFADCNPTK
jgi:hypothetical protein